MKQTINENDLQRIIAESVMKALNENDFINTEIDENVEDEGVAGAVAGGTLGAIFGRAAVDAMYKLLSKSAVQTLLGALIGHAVQEELKKNPALINPFKQRANNNNTKLLGLNKEIGGADAKGKLIGPVTNKLLNK